MRPLHDTRTRPRPKAGTASTGPAPRRLLSALVSRYAPASAPANATELASNVIPLPPRALRLDLADFPTPLIGTRRPRFAPEPRGPGPEKGGPPEPRPAA